MLNCMTRAVLSVRTTDDLRARLDAYAAAHSYRITDVVVSALSAYLNGHEDDLDDNVLIRHDGTTALRALEAAPQDEPDQLSPEQKKAAREAFRAGKACLYCGALHLRFCPRVKSITFRAPGEPQTVTYWREGQFTWPEEIIWPDEIQEEPELPG